MSPFIVLPSIVPERTATCLRTLKPDSGKLVVVDNSVDNRGVAASWNLGIDHLLASDEEWLVLLSAGVVFGEAAGQDFFGALAGHKGVWAVEAGNGLGWHLIAFARYVVERVGRFDENFWPAYYEDNDYSYRIQLAFGIDSRSQPGVPLWPKVDVDAWVPEVAHGIKEAEVTVDFVALEAFYARKWGGVSPNETFTTPFNSGRDISWWPPPKRRRP